MDTQPDKIPDKSFWNGVNNIRLGGNFKIKWLRKKPLGIVTIEKYLGASVKEEVMRTTDGCELDLEIGRAVSLIFETPTEPYYLSEELKQ